MSTAHSLGATRDFMVTSEGHAAALAEGSCQCVWQVASGMLVCKFCGTAFALMRGDGHIAEAKRG